MKKYLKTLLIVPCFLLLLPIMFLAVLRIPPEVFGCDGFGCIGFIFILPLLTVTLTAPVAILLYYLITKYFNFFKGLFIAAKTFIIKPFPKKKLIIFLSLIPTLLLALVVISSLKTDDSLKTKNKKPVQSTPAVNEKETDENITDTELTNWKTYKDYDFGFELNYPQNWNYYLQDTTYFDDIDLWITFDADPKQPRDLSLKNGLEFPWADWIRIYPSGLNIYVSNKPNVELTKTGYNCNLDTEGCVFLFQYEQALFKEIPARFTKPLWPKELANSKFREGAGDGGEIIPFSYYSFKYNEKYWTIAFTHSDFEGNRDFLIDKILSTFTFLPDTSNWKTYTNKKYNYLARYQDDGTIQQNTCGPNPNEFNKEEIFVLIPKSSEMKSCFPLEWYAPVQINVYEGDLSKPEYVKKEMNQDWEIKYEQILIDEREGNKYFLKHIKESQTGCCPDFQMVRVFNDNYTYEIVLGDELEFQDIYNQILSTFQFLE